MGGFSQGVSLGSDVAAQQAAEQQAAKNQQRAQTAALYWNAVQTPLPPPTTKDAQGNPITNPAYTDAMTKREGAIKDYLSYLGPEQHATIGDRLHGLIFGPEHQDMQQSAQAAQAALSPPASAAPSAAAPPQSAHPFSSNPAYTKIQEGLTGLGERLKAFAQPLPKQPAPDYATLAAAPQPRELAEQDAATKAQQAEDLQKLKNEGAIAAVEARGKNPTGRPVPFGRGSVSVKDAQGLAEGGTEFKDQDGNDIDVSKLPESSKLTPWAWGNKIFYTVGDQVPRVVRADNVVTAQPEEGALTPAAQVAPAANLGQARVGSTSTHQVPGMNPGEKITLTGTSTPVGPAAKTPAQVNSDAITKKLNQKRSASRQIPPPSSSNGAPPPAFASGTMLTQGRNAEPIVASMNTVAAQIFGGNGEQPIWNNAWMFNNPDLRTALNKALTLNALAIPGTEEDPSFTQTLATAVGATGWTQEQINNANVQARQDLQSIGGDQALDMFARMAGMQEDLSALRSATRGSAAQGSIRTLVRAAPIYNVSSSQNFRDQLGVTLNTAAAAMSGYPAINSKYIDWWKQGAQKARGAPVSANAPKLNGAKAVHKVGDTVKLKNGQTVKIKHVYPDGSFD